MFNSNRIGLAVLNYNASEKIIENISKISTYNIIDSIIIVDNHSTDKSLEKMKHCFLNNNKVQIIVSDKNGGWSYGYNIACKKLIELNVHYIIIMTPTAFFSEKTASSLCDFLCNNDEYPIVTCIARDKNGEPVSARIGWKRPTYIQLFLDSFFIFRDIVSKKYSYLLDEYDNKSVMPIEVVGGSFYIIRANLLSQINYFDEDIFLYYEENILSSKLDKIGYKYSAVLKKESYCQERSYTVRKNVSPYISFRYMQKSKYIYARKYLKLSRLKLFLLRLSIYYALFEKRVMAFLIRGYQKPRI